MRNLYFLKYWVLTYLDFIAPRSCISVYGPALFLFGMPTTRSMELQKNGGKSVPVSLSKHARWTLIDLRALVD